ncbi:MULTISPECIES: polysaccharide lyase family 1 protein [unclassified Uliginosibacterium]|uniref:pectate lyase family protein n=1 Tax=unclassified Uliginosibacterium TaxID=2621521 RepID=UPI0020B144D0|nr:MULTISPECIES: pectate lyase precursor [unclassified Uliginosibacterium]MDO6384918.1 pectate lyase precursor [Uliginosibacterium sp. 31-12]
MQSKILGGAALLLLAANVQAASDYPTGYTKCAQNTGATCTMAGTRSVALGKSGSFVYATKTDSFACIGSAFPTNTYTTSAWCSYGPLSSSSSSAAVSSAAASSVAASSAASSSKAASSAAASSAAVSSAAASSVAASSAAASSVSAAGIDARTLTGASTPLQNVSGSYTYGVRNYLAPATIDGLHNPTNYKAAPVLPTWQFATVDPTGGVLSFERATAPQNGWHTWSRKGKVVVTGGSAAAANRVYTVFNGQQLVAALAEAGLEPKIVRVVGHIDLRWSANNTVFKEYTSYMDQKYGGSIMIPSNTTLVGINDAQGRTARITGTSILIGGELANGAADAQAGYNAWIAAGKDSEDYPTWTRNIIIRNLQIDAPWDVNPEDSANAYADGMTLSRAQNIYIDHISMGDGDTPDSLAGDTRHDGLLDIVRGSDYTTVTNSYFFKHHKTTLIGNGDSGRAWSDDGRLHVTLSNNFYDRLESRLPLNRYGQVHMFNNYIYGRTDSSVPADLKFGSGVDPRYKSNMLVENMYFEITALATDSFCKKGIDGGNGTNPIGFRSSGHLMLTDKGGNTTPVAWDGQCGYAVPTGANVWTPPYAYTLQTAAAAKASVISNAGAGKLK